jgi:hypothetical protein
MEVDRIQEEPFRYLLESRRNQEFGIGDKEFEVRMEVTHCDPFKQ